MELLDAIMIGVDTAITPTNLLYCFIGVFLGTFFGVLPGIGSLAAVSMLLPVTFYLEPTTALVMLAGVYYGAEYGGSTASILLNLPGTPSNAVTCLDGYPMTQQGRAGVALLTTTIASFIGGTVGILALFAFAPLIVQFALVFGPAEYFALMVFGLVAAATVTQDIEAGTLPADHERDGCKGEPSAERVRL